ncbi:hypothetical protein SAMN05660860_03388 [Geoalkalibacter ferrihydriticus]|uniref:Oligosaccharide repeat unit polymerase n=2 Tax=Geoalkalibacter ferrihydriticus TaxID=392333 RepID=A0A0C2HEP0_9BACT|nr:O-antigen polymerase [Geoalkalibacter ferrihydriticus]KIH75416.1 hypothetical protein GFER_16645 [Geoalkalibacter ferrihydriticus DSM 17813]SDM92056.1 hypothetical protein SAMN05660860_03388 [Geoalkalibacter ferrihydriticus]
MITKPEFIAFQGFSYFALLAFIALVEYRRNKNSIIDFLSIFNFVFCVFYVISPVVSLFIAEDLVSIHNLRGLKFYISQWYTPLLAWFGYLSFLAGYNFTPMKFYIVSMRFKVKKLPFLYFSFLMIIFGMFILFSFDYGGVKNMVVSLVLSRHSGLNVETGTFAFLWKLIRPLSVVALYAAFLFFIKNLSRVHFLKRKSFWIFLLALSLFLVVGFAHASRGFLFFSLFGLMVIFANFEKKIPWRFAFAFFTGLLLLIVYGKAYIATLGHYLAIGDMSAAQQISLQRYSVVSELYPVLLEFSRYTIHAVNSMQAGVVEFGNYELRLFYNDILSALISQVPQGLLGIKLQIPEHAAILTSEIIAGNPNYGYVPGLIGACVFSLFIPGIFFGCFLYGAMCKVFHCFFHDNIDRSFFIYAIYVKISISLSLFISTGVLTNIISGNMGIFVALFFLLPFLKIKSSCDGNFVSNINHKGIIRHLPLYNPKG